MGLMKQKYIEQMELEAFCDYLYDADPTVDIINYRKPTAFSERLYRDKITKRFKSKETGLDYLWDKTTIVFCPDSGDYPMIVKVKGATDHFITQPTTAVV